MNPSYDTRYTDHDNNSSIPDDFICPLTLNIIRDPVMVQSGRSFERHAILEWLRRGNATCPLTRQPMQVSDLVSNHALQVKIQKWKLEQHHDNNSDTDGETEDHSEDDEDDDEYIQNHYGLFHAVVGEESMERIYERLVERQLRLQQRRRRQQQQNVAGGRNTGRRIPGNTAFPRRFIVWRRQRDNNRGTSNTEATTVPRHRLSI